MEIRIKTAEEFQAAHVTIEIKAADQAEAGTVVEKLIDDEGAGPLQARINDLEDRLVKECIRASSLQRQVKAYDTDRHTERDRADRVTQEHSACAGKLALREKDANTFQRQRDQLEIKVAELEAERERSADNHNALANRVTELEADLVRVRDDRQMVLTQRDKALTRVGELDRELRMAQQSIEARDRLLGTATTKIENARGILSNPEVTRVCERIASRGITFLSREISKAIDALA
jgi:chromosome segregation ATPase